MEPGIYSDLSNEDYHGGPGISKSGLDLIARCPALYRDRYIDGNRPEPTNAMVIGSATHTAVFEPHLFDSEFAVAPAVDRRTKAGKAAYAAFLEDSEGKEVLPADDYEKIMRISEAVRGDSRVSSMLAEGQAETSIFHTDESTGELVKVRPDWMPSDLLIDLKTTDKAGPEDFSRSCWNFRYFVQAGMYIEVANEAFLKETGVLNRFQNFLFIVVEKTEPYQVAVYFADASMLQAGKDEYRRCLDLYSKLKNENHWPGYNNDKIVPINLPAWAENRL